MQICITQYEYDNLEARKDGSMTVLIEKYLPAAMRKDGECVLLSPDGSKIVFEQKIPKIAGISRRGSPRMKGR